MAYRVVPFSPAIERQMTADQLGILEKLNREDLVHLQRSPTVIVPDVWSENELDYSPLPLAWPWAVPQAKLIVVHQPAQVFGAYEAGRLVRWGPISSGREITPTPAGFFHLTWRSKSRRSTDNREWILKWYFNFVNERGVSFHQFELPGRPASHACVRLLDRDAKWVYDWGEQWELAEDKHHVAREGSAVLVIGTYDFKRPPPWLSLDWWQQGIVLPEDPLR